MSIIVAFLVFLEAGFAFYLLIREGVLRTTSERILSAFLISAVFVLRACFFNHHSGDYNIFLSHWVDFYRTNGGISALSSMIGDYNVPYNCFLALISYLPLNDLHLIKLFSVLFDVILAWSSMKLVSHFTDSHKKTLASFIVVLFLPTIFMNSSIWGQCDSIFTSMAILGIYLALEDKPYASMVCIAISFSFKLQAVFIMPIYAVLWMYKKFNWKHFLLFPVTYFALMLPALFAGMPLRDVLLIYVNLSAEYDWLNMNSSSIFALFNGTSSTLWAKRSLAAAFVFLLAVLPSLAKIKFILTRKRVILLSALLVVVFSIAYFLFFVWPDNISAVTISIFVAASCVIAILLICFINRSKLSDDLILVAAALFSIVIPLLLPYMHERYFIIADILTVVILFALNAYPIRIYLLLSAILTQLASMVGYYRYLFPHSIFASIPLSYGTIALILSLAINANIFILLLLNANKSPDSQFVSEIQSPTGVSL